MALLLLWPAIALGAAAVLWSVALLDLKHERHDREAELEQQVDSYARSLIIRTRRSIGDADRLLLLLRHNWTSSGQRLDLTGTIEAGIFSQQFISAVALIDRNGIVLSSSHADAPGRDFSGKAAIAPFRTHRRAALAATSFYLRAKWKQHQIETIRSTYRLATEDAGEGFFINRPLRDAHGKVRDFEVVDCNQHGADMFGIEPGRLIGHRLSEFYHGKLFEAACARLVEALDTGLHDSELQVTAANPASQGARLRRGPGLFLLPSGRTWREPAAGRPRIPAGDIAQILSMLPSR